MLQDTYINVMRDFSHKFYSYFIYLFWFGLDFMNPLTEGALALEEGKNKRKTNSQR